MVLYRIMPGLDCIKIFYPIICSISSIERGYRSISPAILREVSSPNVALTMARDQSKAFDGPLPSTISGVDTTGVSSIITPVHRCSKPG